MDHSTIMSGSSSMVLNLSALEAGRAYEERETVSCCTRISRAISPSIAEIGNFFGFCNRWYYNHTTRFLRNVIRVLIAGGLSTIGGGFSGDPRVKAFFHISTITAVWIGSGIGGAGNALSTYLAWETGLEKEVASMKRQLDTLVVTSAEHQQLIANLHEELKIANLLLDEVRARARKEDVEKSVPEVKEKADG